MDVRVLDLDGSVAAQDAVTAAHPCAIVPLREWAPNIRMACSFARFRRFERHLGRLQSPGPGPAITFIGSGDFHHVSLAMVRRVTQPINLLVLDTHPDWMRGVPFMHCGTWLYHAACLPHIRQIFHVGGEVDFDNYYQWMAPWRLLRAGRIVVFPAYREFTRRGWSAVMNFPLKRLGESCVESRLEHLVGRFARELARVPLYISLDKDVLASEYAPVNWDSGYLEPSEVHKIMSMFMRLAGGRLAGMDVVGDWSPVHVRGGLRRLMHLTEHPRLEMDPEEAQLRNGELNAKLLQWLDSAILAGSA